MEDNNNDETSNDSGCNLMPLTPRGEQCAALIRMAQKAKGKQMRAARQAGLSPACDDDLGDTSTEEAICMPITSQSLAYPDPDPDVVPCPSKLRRLHDLSGASCSTQTIIIPDDDEITQDDGARPGPSRLVEYLETEPDEDDQDFPIYNVPDVSDLQKDLAHDREMLARVIEQDEMLARVMQEEMYAQGIQDDALLPLVRLENTSDQPESTGETDILELVAKGDDKQVTPSKNDDAVIPPVELRGYNEVIRSRIARETEDIGPAIYGFVSQAMKDTSTDINKPDPTDVPRTIDQAGSSGLAVKDDIDEPTSPLSLLDEATTLESTDSSALQIDSDDDAMLSSQKDSDNSEDNQSLARIAEALSSQHDAASATAAASSSLNGAVNGHLSLLENIPDLIDERDQQRAPDVVQQSIEQPVQEAAGSVREAAPGTVQEAVQESDLEAGHGSVGEAVQQPTQGADKKAEQESDREPVQGPVAEPVLEATQATVQETDPEAVKEPDEKDIQSAIPEPGPKCFEEPSQETLQEIIKELVDKAAAEPSHERVGAEATVEALVASMSSSASTPDDESSEK
ncbi:uncharacterized protein LOC142986299 isoform X2 [Anticarsia gemmatalis]|uniref:uncharacterized protein LOC142986299 isoform X2 n=1 Tax=Anticarsia gemmatalis TaxID=129554 RepID=UPI003F7593B7